MIYKYYGCSSLFSVDIPSSVTDIWDFAFYGCISLTSIEIPNNVIRIGKNVFDNCCKLQELHIRYEHPENIEIDEDAFDGLSECTLFVPIGTGYAYRHDERFKGKFKEVKIER